MPLRSDLSAWLMQKTGPLTVRYGRDLVFSGRDLPRRRTRIATRHGSVRCEVYEPAEVGVRVVNVDYDVAPQVRYPVAHEQAHDVLAHAANDGPVLVGGFSAGGNLAASAALQARDLGSCEPRLQLLGVPSLDVAQSGSTDKRPVVGRSPMITPELISLVRRTYFADAARRAEPYASPLRATTLEGVAPALMIAAERDLLRAEGDAYAARLLDAGVPVEHLLVTGADHYFLTGRDQARQVLDRVVGSMRKCLDITAG